MRILRVIATMDPRSGGPCEGIRNSIPVQKKFGIENEVLSFDSEGEDFINSSKFKIHAIGPAKAPYAYCAGLKGWLEENIESFNVVIIHGLWLYNSYGTYKLWKGLKKKNKKVPGLFVMPHGMLDPYFQRSKTRRFKALRNLIFWKLIEKRVVNGADGLLFTCEQELLLAKETFKGYNPKAVFNVGYGLQAPPSKKIKFLEAFLEKCPEIKGKSYWLFLSRIHPKKGVDLLIKAYLKLKKEVEEIPDMVIAGPGLETPFGKEIQKLGTHSSIHFPGMLKGKAKWGAFHFSEAFILPSHQENFGIAVVEAMACTKPVLITDQINIWKEIETGNGGFISKDTEEGIFQMLKKWYNLSDLTKAEISLNAYKVYRDKFSIEKTALKMVECVQDNKSSGMAFFNKRDQVYQARV
ncbi:glycosyltransferase [Gramella sp. MT6]|uniref:glycosyltransferase n=1 Tax=Gramella sp. MT6 TaxID=2705471 RepID=UPI001C798407|nr:glycosyltransferase [Gramella sp. MT6]QYA25193.1 glycosyltransferase [Gramella sp. MT6]